MRGNDHGMLVHARGGGVLAVPSWRRASKVPAEPARRSAWRGAQPGAELGATRSSAGGGAHGYSRCWFPRRADFGRWSRRGRRRPPAAPQAPTTRQPPCHGRGASGSAEMAAQHGSRRPARSRGHATAHPCCRLPHQRCARRRRQPPAYIGRSDHWRCPLANGIRGARRAAEWSPMPRCGPKGGGTE